MKILFVGVLLMAIGLILSLISLVIKKDKPGLAVGVVGLIAMLIGVALTFFGNNLAASEEKQFYTDFENGTYIVDVEKCFDVYQITSDETIKAIASNTDKTENKIEIQKSTNNTFVVDFDGEYIVLNVSTVKLMVEEAAIKLE